MFSSGFGSTSVSDCGKLNRQEIFIFCYKLCSILVVWKNNPLAGNSFLVCEVIKGAGNHSLSQYLP
jgi:hypothetical protein